MAAFLRKCVCLGARGTMAPGSDQDYRNNRNFFLETRTSWVRMWASWDKMQPDPNIPLGQYPAGSAPANILAGLDAQIEQARIDGLHVVLVAFQFPPWSNVQTRQTAGAHPKANQPYFAFPDNLTPTGPWGKWIRFLIERYRVGNYRGKHGLQVLEIVNEPNGQCWPQTLRDPNVSSMNIPVAHCDVAQMFQSALAIRNGFSASEPILAGPATDDADGNSVNHTDYLNFTTNLIAQLRSINFTPGRYFAWSHHNYVDQEYDQGSKSRYSRTMNRAATVQNALTGTWTGWPYGNANKPFVLITEGGVRRNKLTAPPWSTTDVDWLQRSLIQSSWNRMATETGEGEGIAMFPAYHFWTSGDAAWDTGLLDAYPSTRKRPAYDLWASFPRYL